MKKILLLPSLVFLLFHNQLSAQNGLFSGLVGQYPFNGDGLDYSGNQNDMVLQSVNAAAGVEGWMYSGYLHNSPVSTIKRQAFSLPDSSSICGWVYSADSMQAAGIFYNGHSGSSGYGIFLKDPLAADGKGKKLVILRGGISQETIGQYEMPLNTWKHISLVKNMDDYKVYVDGVLKLEASGFSIFPQGLFSIGAPQEHLDNLLPAFKGIIDNVYVFGRVLSQNEILELMNLSVSHAGISQWKSNFSDYVQIENRRIHFKSSEILQAGIIGADGKNWNCQGTSAELPPGFYIVKIETESQQRFQQKILIR